MLEEIHSIASLRESLATAATQHASLRAHLALAEALRAEDPHDSLTHASAALTIARSLGREDDVAVARMSVGMTQVVLGDCREACEHLEAAYRDFIKGEEHERAWIAA